MAEEKIIAVAGATGGQGGSLVRAILADSDGGYRPRALTRDPSSDKARALSDAGAEVVAADIDDAENLRAAFEGAHGAFCVTFFWEHFSPEQEKRQARSMADAARSCGLEHVIWSTLEDTRDWIPLDDDRMPTLMEQYKVPHFDAKGEADQFFADLPATCMRTSFYWDNLIGFGMGPKRGEDGTLTFSLPMGDRKLPGIAVADIGRCAYGLFKTEEDFHGKTVGVAGDHLTGAQMAEALSRALGEEVGYSAVPFDVYRGLGFPGAEDLGNMFQFKHDFEEVFCSHRDLQLARSINPDLQSFDTWLAANKEQIPLE